MAAGLVTIATPVGGVPDVITDGVDGILVSPGRPEDLSCALASLVDNADRRVQLANAARERARNFELTAWYEELARIWTGLILSRGRGEVGEQRGRSSGRI
jgi:glycosyltransferase involved in cell wall biosynthesis